jgi:hypothetical protein
LPAKLQPVAEEYPHRLKVQLPLGEQSQPESLLQPPDRPQDVAMDGRSGDDELAAQLTMAPEYTLSLQFLAMRNHLADDEWVT